MEQSGRTEVRKDGKMKVGNTNNGTSCWKGKWEIIKIMEHCWRPEVWKVEGKWEIIKIM